MNDTQQTDTRSWYERYATEPVGETYGVRLRGHVARFKVNVVVTGDHTATYERLEVCSRCGGLGGGSQWSHTGYTCFECGGHGQGKLRTVKLYTAEKLAKLNATAAKADEKRRAKAEAAALEAEQVWSQWKAENADVLIALDSERGNDRFVTELVERVDQGFVLSSAQLAAGVTAVERVKARRDEQAKRAFVGTVGERIAVTLTTTKVIQLDSFEPNAYRWNRFMANRSLVLMTDAAGNVFKYVGSGDFPREGETRTGKVTVKEHAEYKGTKQTVVERPKWDRAEEPKVVSQVDGVGGSGLD